MTSIGAALLLLCLLSACSPQANRSEGVQLLLSTAELGPATTFELRFEQPMVRSSEVGLPVRPSPLLFRPALAGHFAWTSPRGGVFAPDVPMALGTEYELSLQPGPVQADGQPCKARLQHLLRTPPFGIAATEGPQPNTNALSEPEFRLWFNADIRVAELSGRVRFVNGAGEWAPAEVRQGIEEDRNSGYYYRGRTAMTWREGFPAQPPAQGQAGRVSKPDAEPSPTNEIANLVVVRPMKPLGLGRNWRLVLPFRLAGEDGLWSSGRSSELLVGDITEFTLQQCSMHHVLNQEPELRLLFSKALDPALTNSFTQWLQIAPWPDGVEASVEGRNLSLSKGWRRGTNYLVTLRHGLPSEEAFVLKRPVSFSAEVPPVDPRLYFTEFSFDQFASGNRTFPLLAVNVDNVRVRAKLLDAPTAIHALRGYESYFDARPRHYHRDSEGFHRLDYNLVPGRTAFQENLLGSRQPDVAETIPLNWDRLLNGRKTGVVFLEAERPEFEPNPSHVLGTQALIQLTDLGMAWKTGATQLQAFVFSYATAQPVTNARVQLFSGENELLQETTTDAAGLASLPPLTNAQWLAVQQGQDLHDAKLSEGSIPLWQFGLPTRWHDSGDQEAARVALFTDRDVYRPGESVNLKAIAREVAELGLSIPAGSNGLVTCADAQGREFFETNVTLSAFGSCTLSIPLPLSPRGEYQATFKLGGQEYHKAFQLADYQPAAFEIHMESKAAYGADEALEVPVSARYLFGQALNKARVRWWLEAEDQSFQPTGFSKFQFELSSLESRWERRPGSFSVNGEGQLAAGSNFLLRTDLPLNSQAPQPRLASLMVEVTDLDQQTLTHTVAFVKHSSDYYLGLKRLERVVEPGQALPLELAAVAADGTPWPAAVRAHLKLSRVEWQSIRIQGTGRAARYRNESSLTNLLERDVVVSPPTRLSKAEKDFDGSPVDALLAPSAGEYLVEVTASDEHGHPIASSLIFNVTEKAKLAWDYRNEVELKLVPDRPSYQPGDTALVLLKAPISGTAWVTVERDRVLRSFVTRLEGNAPAIRVPLQPGDAPNVFVSVTLMRGAAESPHRVREPEYRVGYCQLNVEDPATHLQVEVTPSVRSPRFSAPAPVAGSNSALAVLPGELLTVEARVQDSQGQPASNAEVTLYAVDEGVLSLTDYATPDLQATFMGPRALGVSSFISLPCLMPEDPERLSFQNKGYLGGGGGSERLRQRFLACPFWNASLLTDAEGRVTASFTVPDSLTRYRLIAVAQSLRSQFGTGQSKFTVSKPLMVEPSLPQAANVTDTLQAHAVVFNQTAEAGEVLVTLQLDDKARAPGGTNVSQTLQVPAHSSVAVEFPVTLTAPGAAKWLWHARFAQPSTNGFADLVQSTLQVGLPGPRLREVVSARVDTGETNLLGLLNPQLLAGDGTLTVSIANTRLVTLSEAIQQLLHYPYGCVEQTSSSLLPWIVLQDTPALLALTRRDPAEAPAVLKTGIRRLLSMQTASGGLSYWPGGNEPHVWGSSYGALVLELATQAGIAVPEKELRSLLTYLSKQLRQPATDEEGLNAQCLALYVLALADRSEPAYQTQLFESRSRLTAEDRALLALSLTVGQASPPAGSAGIPAGSSSSAPQPSPMLPELLHSPHPTSDPASSTPFSCSARATAIRLLALLASQPGSRECDELFHKLEADQKHGHWDTTQGNAWALLALRAYLRASESNLPAGTGTLAWGDDRKTFQLQPGCGLFTNTFPLSASTADKPLRLANYSPQPMYVQIVVESRLTASPPTPQDHGFRLERRYERLSDDNQPQSAEHLRVGDRVLVTLRLSVPQVAQYLVVDDPLPGVLEAVNTQFSTQQLAPGSTPPAWMTQDGSDRWYSDFQELRADRVLFFGDYVSRGKYVLRYVARVRAAGTVTASAAKAEEMYHPDHFGLSGPQSITSEGLKVER